jgi:hypothetical protein
MSTEKQRDASRANGAKSLGPVTEEGKAKSSQNARKKPSLLFLFNETSKDFQIRLRHYLVALRPKNPVEEDLILAMARAKHLEDRAYFIQTAILNDKQSEIFHSGYVAVDEPTLCARAVQELANESRVLAECRWQLEKSETSYYRALRHLELIRRKSLIEDCSGYGSMLTELLTIKSRDELRNEPNPLHPVAEPPVESAADIEPVSAEPDYYHALPASPINDVNPAGPAGPSQAEEAQPPA